MTEPSVYFIGAGPGDPELLTVKAQRILQRADVIIYADSLIHPGICAGARPDAEIHGSSTLPLERILEIMIGAAQAGKLVARAQSGDPSIYGAIHEQMAALDRAGVSYAIIPGVSSAFAAAAALGTELTVPDIAQSVIFTRVSGRTGLPPNEQLSAFARHGVTMAIFLSIALIERVVTELLAGGYPPETPVAVVHRVAWEDEMTLRGTLSDIAEQVRSAKLAKQALIMVGPVFNPQLHAQAGENHSHLYDAAYTHMFRKGTWRRGASAGQDTDTPVRAAQ